MRTILAEQHDNTRCRRQLTTILAASLLCLTQVLTSTTVIADEADAPPGLAGDTANRVYEDQFRDETIEIHIAPGEQMEYVLNMEQGDSLLYTWSTQGDPIYSDFHAAPEDKKDYPDNYWIRYEESEDNGANGAVVAPFDGHTAWYWVNRTDDAVTLTLRLVGYFTDNEIAFRRMPD